MLFPNHLPYDINYRAPSIDLQELLVAENKLLWKSSISRVRDSLVNRTSWHWITSQRGWLHNHLLHHYVNMVDENRRDFTSGAMASSVDALSDRCFLLGAGIALRHQQQEVLIVGMGFLAGLQ